MTILRIGPVLGFLAFAALDAAAAETPAPAPPALSPPPAPTYRVVLDAPAVRVLLHKVDPNEDEPLHAHPCTFNYALGNYAVESVNPAGIRTPMRRQLRSAWARPAESHLIRNPGPSTARHLMVEFTAPLAGVDGCGPAASEPLPPLANDHALRVAPGAYKKVYETAAYRVMEFLIEPGTSTVMHQVGCGVTVSLADAVLQVQEAQAPPARVEVRSGVAWWRPAVQAVYANPSKVKIVALVLEFKRPPPGATGC